MLVSIPSTTADRWIAIADEAIAASGHTARFAGLLASGLIETGAETRQWWEASGKGRARDLAFNGLVYGLSGLFAAARAQCRLSAWLTELLEDSEGFPPAMAIAAVLWQAALTGATHAGQFGRAQLQAAAAAHEAAIAPRCHLPVTELDVTGLETPIALVVEPLDGKQLLDPQKWGPSGLTASDFSIGDPVYSEARGPGVVVGFSTEAKGSTRIRCTFQGSAKRVKVSPVNLHKI